MKKRNMLSTLSIEYTPKFPVTKAAKIASCVLETSCVQGYSLDELAKVSCFLFEVIPHGVGD